MHVTTGPGRRGNALLSTLAEALFPARCALCGARDSGRGLGCAEHAIACALEGPRCSRCARALPPMLADGDLCRFCRTDPPAFARTRVVADYGADPALREWILAFKHGGRRDLAPLLGAVLATLLLDTVPTAPCVLVPVPLHWRRRFERGYDQALLLARAAADAARVECVSALRRVRSTPTQGAPLAPRRTDNVKHAFAPSPFVAPRARRGRRSAVMRLAVRLDRRPSIEGRAVWLVDDVMTSGATADACARVLLDLGAAEVGVLALARARGPREGDAEDAGPLTES